MNRPPTDFVRVAPDALAELVRALFQQAGMGAAHAAWITDCLVNNDLRGVVSHGTRQVTAYVDHFRAGRLTPTPEVVVTDESPTTLTVDGGGGLGYFPAQEAAVRLGPKALEMGVAVALTRNHGHIGAAGLYSRIPLEHGLFCYVTSGHQLELKKEDSILTAAGGSPMSFALPTGEEPPFVLDFGAMHDLYAGSTHVREIIEMAPGTVFRSIGLGAVCQALGGFLAGVPVDPARARRQWEGANQGSLMIAVDLSRFMPLEQFRREMDEYSRRVREMQPLPGYDQALLAGGLEYQREQEYREVGIPLSPRHAQALGRLADDYGLTVPFPVSPEGAAS